MDLWVREARIFKYGSGTGSNFSSLRGEGEPLSGGGKSSGLMSFLKIGDRAAGAIKSGGTTRRAAKMVVLDLDHPDIEEFINWKVVEEEKVAVAGDRLAAAQPPSQRHPQGLRTAGRTPTSASTARSNADLRKAIAEARRRLVPVNYIERMLQLAAQGFTSLEIRGIRHRLELEGLLHRLRPEQQQLGAHRQRLHEGGARRTAPGISTGARRRKRPGARAGAPKPCKTLRARDLWDQIAYAAWSCADPGVQFDTTINEWHTCPADGRINASNPCSEYMFLDDTACNLASLNLLKFYDAASGRFDVDSFRHASRLWTLILEISVYMAQFPSVSVAQKSYDFRTLGLGYANMGSLLMVQGCPTIRRRAGPSARADLRPDARGLLRHVRGDGRRGRAVPALRGQPRSHAARRPQPSPRRLRRPARAVRRADRSRRSASTSATAPPTCWRPPAASATAWWTWARSMAIATPRSRASRRPAPSAWSWTATPPASSRTSPW